MGKKTIIYPVFVPMIGCPHQCAFCNQRSITGKSITNLLEDVSNQVKSVMDTAAMGGGKREIAFFGGSFTCLSMELQNTILGLAHPYLEAGYIDGIRISTRPDYISEPILENLQRNGLTTIELGIQSTDSYVLKASERGYTYEEILPALNNLQNYDLKVGLQMMIGLPYDSLLKSLKTAMDFVSLGPDFVRIYPTLVVKGAALEEKFQRGVYKPLSIVDAIEWSRDTRIIFENYNIDVIRTGLQSQEGFDKGQDLIAGPYHPAFGEMVESAIYRIWMDYIVKVSIDKNEDASSKGIVFYVHPTRLSQAIGQRRANILYLKKNYPDIDITFKQDRVLGIDELRVSIDEKPIIYKREAFISQRCDGIREFQKLH